MRLRWLFAVVGAFLALTPAVVDRPTLAPAAPPAPAVVIGDSLTAGNVSAVRAAYTAQGLDGTVIDALSGRNIDVSINYSWGFVPSGVAAATALRRSGVDSEVWVVELGANNLSTIERCGCDRQALATSMIDAMRAAIGPRTIAWVNVRASVFPDAVAAFNAALAAEDAADDRFLVIDWYGYSAGKDWFVDHVHPNIAGALALAACMAASTRWIIDAPATATTTTTSTVPPEVPAPAVQGAATAGASAERLGRTATSASMPDCAVLVSG